VAGEGQRVQPAGGEVDGQRADGLHGVAVHRDAVLVGDVGERRHRLHGAHLVVGPHDGDQRDVGRVALDRLAQRLRVHAAGPVDLEPVDGRALVLHQPLDGVEHGVVLDRAGQDAPAARVGVVPRPPDALDGEVVALGAAGGEHDLRRPRAERGGQRLARLLDDAARAAAAVCSDEALPAVVSEARRAAVTASTASGSMGVEAAWSR
jgi:hypothetical protein